MSGLICSALVLRDSGPVPMKGNHKHWLWELLHAPLVHSEKQVKAHGMPFNQEWGVPPKYAVNKDSPTYSRVLKRDNPPLGMLPEPLWCEGTASEFTILIKRESVLTRGPGLQLCLGLPELREWLFKDNMKSEAEAASTGPAWLCTRSSVHRLKLSG